MTTSIIAAELRDNDGFRETFCRAAKYYIRTKGVDEISRCLIGSRTMLKKTFLYVVCAISTQLLLTDRCNYGRVGADEPARATAVESEILWATRPESSYHVYTVSLSLPADGVWTPAALPKSETTIVQLYLLPSEEVGAQQLGRRMGEVLQERRIEQGRWKTQSVTWACREYAKRHGNTGPKSIDDLVGDRYQWVRNNVNSSPWGNDVDIREMGNLKGPFVYLLPSVPFHFVDSKEDDFRIQPGRREILAFELRPYLNDNKHWIVYTDGNSERVVIDQQLLTQSGQVVRPVLEGELLTKVGPTARYDLVAVSRGKIDKTVGIALLNSVAGEQLTRPIDFSTTKSDTRVWDTLQKARRFHWNAYLDHGPAPVMRSWLNEQSADDGNQNRNRSSSSFAVLGGRAAVEETLQLQNIQTAKADGSLETIDLSTLEGVTVKAHPFAEMLAGREGGQLELANYVPADRLFVYVAKPSSIIPFLDRGASFIASGGALATSNRLDYGLEQRYLERLGMQRAWLEQILQAGLVRDLVVTSPDLYFIDGTDVTVVARVAQPALLQGLLRVLGVGGVANNLVVTHPTRGGDSYWHLRDNILCISSSRNELAEVMRLLDSRGEGSLGRSDEFRYMLMQLPIHNNTRMLGYLSDPFIRRLVGPKMKLSQARRILDRARMEFLAAQLLKARLDGVDVANSSTLKRLRYLPDAFPVDDYQFDRLGVVSSRRYGPLPRMKTLDEAPLQRVTPEEAQGYKNYVENYSRYWRRFFDPIALRLDESTEGSLQLTTFILPLVDNSIYESVRQSLVHRGVDTASPAGDSDRVERSGTAGTANAGSAGTAEGHYELDVPVVDPMPVLQFSANLRDEAWKQITRNFSELFRQYGGASPALLDDLGPGFHLMIYDADPVIALGSGDLMGAFGSQLLGGGRETVMLPVALSLLTRPCSIYVETRAPERTARYLRQAANNWLSKRQNDSQQFRASFYQLDGKDSWVWSMEILGAVKLRYGVEVQDRYLVIRNIPWSTDDKVVRVERQQLNGAALIASPAACRLQLPGLFASAADQDRRAALSGMGRLYPLVLSGAADMGAAADLHRQLFGFQPLHPGDGHWRWEDHHVTSSTYGSVLRQRQPAYDPQKPMGLLHGIERIELNMQFEQDGLRSTIQWRMPPRI
ncbi:MAG: hypothetical protein R3E01_11985 [Pirellulaceae bacterium]